MKRLALLLPFALVSAAWAQEPADTVHPVKVTLDLGYINAAGNTNVSTLSTGEHLEYRANRMELLQHGSIIYGRNEDVTTTEQILTGARINYLVTKVVGLFVGAGYERNRFAGLARRWDENAGLALRLIDQPKNNWMMELGAALNQERTTLGASRNYTSFRGATTLRHNFTKKSFLQQSIEVMPTMDDWNDTRMNSETAMVAPISGNVALRIAYLIKFDNEPEPGFGKSDRIFTSGIQVVF